MTVSKTKYLVKSQPALYVVSSSMIIGLIHSEQVLVTTKGTRNKKVIVLRTQHRKEANVEVQNMVKVYSDILVTPSV